MITFEMLTRRWPHAPHDFVTVVAAGADTVFSKYGLVTPAEQADLLAQVSEETGGATALEENLNYSALRLTQVWPSRFPTLEAALPYARNPKGLANNVYGGRYGNVAGTDDGWNFRGRGAMQTTFRANYAQTAKDTGLDCVNHPELLTDPNHFLECACAFWKNAGLNTDADGGNFVHETRVLNGGLINLQARQQWRQLWRAELCTAQS